MPRPFATFSQHFALFCAAAISTAACAQETVPTTVPEIAPTAPPSVAETPTPQTATAPTGSVRLEADLIRYAGQVAILSAEPGRFVTVTSGTARIRAQNVEFDIGQKTLRARGMVEVQRTRLAQRRLFTPDRERARDIEGPDTARQENVGRRFRSETVVEVLRGQDLVFDAKTQIGQLDGAEVRLENFDITAAKIELGNRSYTARDVILRPGGLSDAERKIYGTPPFSLRARRLTANVNEAGGGNISARGAGLYFRNTRILPVPSAIFPSVTRFGPSRGTAAYRVLPDISLNSADGFYAATRIALPLANFDKVSTDANTKRRTTKFDLNAFLELGLSAKLGFRGGAALEATSPVGFFALRARRKDVVTTQLTNRIVLDRQPEVQYQSPTVPLFTTRGFGIGIYGAANAGRYEERLIDTPAYFSRSTRTQTTLALTTRVADRDGIYFDLFRTQNRYQTANARYNQNGFEVGYAGNVLRNVRGLISYRRTNLRGTTPFRFDVVEIPRELRTTLDIQISPRYIVPIDLRYDFDAKRFQDETFGLLRSYKTFAYGLVYQVARRDLRLEFRSAF